MIFLLLNEKVLTKSWYFFIFELYYYYKYFYYKINLNKGSKNEKIKGSYKRSFV